MTEKKDVDDCFQWISNQQTQLEKLEFGGNKRALEESLAEQNQRLQLIADYEREVDKIKDGSKDQLMLADLQRSYDNLGAMAHKRLDCLKTMSQIALMEEIFSTITNDFSTKATSLVEKIPSKCKSDDNLELQKNGSTPNSAQSCILAMRNNWSWLIKLLECSKTHLQHSSEYHQFFHDMKEYENWMPIELSKAEDLLNYAQMKRNQQGQDAGKLIFEIKTALAMFFNWQAKIDSIFERSRHLVPVPLRTKTLDHEKPARVLCDYKTKEMLTQDGEEVIILNNSKTNTWKVRNLRGEEFEVPSVIILIPGPDPAAVDAAMKLRLHFLTTWSHMMKRYGKTIILFLLQVIRVWTPIEESLLRALSDQDKQEIYHLLDSIEKTFSPYWEGYPPYQLLKTRMAKMREILGQKPSQEDLDAANSGQLVVVQTKILEELLEKFREYWKNWETFKVLTETLNHPEYLLSVDKWDELSALEIDEWIKKWQTSLDFDEVDFMDMGKANLNAVHTLDTSKETAETSQLTTSEQEERQTFIITGVTDPRSGEEISLDEAVNLGIINQTEGRYVNPSTNESVPIPVAMTAGKIKVEMTTTKKSVEKRQDIGLITIKTIKESRPYKIKGVVDAKTEKQMSLEEAVKAGIVNQKKGIYRNLSTKEELSLADALDSGLLIVEFEKDSGENREPEIETKTYAVHAVIDVKNKNRVGFAEAVQLGLINPDTGAYFNAAASEHLYIGDAIKKGFVKATVVNDPKMVDIAPGNRITLTDNALDNFKSKIMPPIKAMNALRKGAENAHPNIENGNDEN